MAIDCDDVKDIPLLAALGEAQVSARLQSGDFRLRSLGKGQLLHSEGEACDRLEILLSGRLCIERLSESGNLVTIAVFRRGDSIGGNLLFSRRPQYALSVTALEETRLLTIGRGPLFRR